jgi:hypothetical protein
MSAGSILVGPASDVALYFRQGLCVSLGEAQQKGPARGAARALHNQYNQSAGAGERIDRRSVRQKRPGAVRSSQDFAAG